MTQKQKKKRKRENRLRGNNPSKLFFLRFLKKNQAKGGERRKIKKMRPISEKYCFEIISRLAGEMLPT